MTSVQASKIPPPAAHIHEAIDGFHYASGQAKRILSRLGSVDMRRYETLAAATGVELLARGPFQQVLGAVTDAMRLLATLPTLVSDVHEESSTDAAFELDLGEEEPTPAGTPFDGDARPAVLERFCEEVESALDRLTETPAADMGVEAVDGLCRMLVRGLREARTRLLAARQQQSKWGLISAAEEARRKTQRSLRAGLYAAARLLGVPEDELPFVQPHSEVQSALRVRETLLAFRTDVLLLTAGITDASPAGYRSRAQRCLHRIATLIREPTYHELRAADRHSLQSLRARVVQWLGDAAADPEGGRQALLDLHAFADLLASVNNRELLVQHDRALKREIAEELETCLVMSSVGSRAVGLAYRAALDRLRPLAWRDERLAAHLEAEHRLEGDESLDRRVFQTLTLLAAVRI